MKPALLFLLMAGLGGCAIGPDYERPPIPLPRHYAAAEAETPVSIRADWWADFKDPVLTELIHKALAQNADLALATGRLAEAQGLAKEAGAAFLPEVTADASVAKQHSSGKTQSALASGTPGTTYTSRKGTLSTSFELDVWGKLRRAYESASAQIEATRYARDSVRLSLEALVCHAYFNLRSLDSQLTAQSNTVESREETLRLVKLRVEAGLSSPLETHQAETALGAAQAQRAILRQQRAASESLLGLLVGEPGLSLRPSTLLTLPIPPQPPAGLPSDILSARPDVRQAEATLIAANARIGVAKAAYFPKLSLTGYLGSESRELEDLFRAGAGIWSTGLALAVPVFDFGKTSARVDQATAQQQQTLAAYRKTVQTAFKEVNDALVGLRETREAATAQENRHKGGTQALEIARKRYAAGSIGYLEFLDAQRSANEAELAWLSGRQNQLGATVDLFKTLGGGWKPLIEPETTTQTP